MVGDVLHSNTNTIEYITIATFGNGTDFGDLIGSEKDDHGCIKFKNKWICSAGRNMDSQCQNTIDYVTIATTGNATDFGDLTQARTQPLAFSDVHGGLG